MTNTERCPRCGKANPADVHTCTPLSTDEIEAGLGHEPLDYGAGFFAGVRWAEMQHGIAERGGAPIRHI